MARPGRINRLGRVAIQPPGALSHAAACVAFALLDADVTYHTSGYGEQEDAYLRLNTASRHVEASTADFLFLFGTGSPAPLHEARTGLLAYPDASATAVLQVGPIGKSSATGGLQLELSGPGIESREIVFVAGLRPEFLEILAERNREFPLGLDAILVSPDDCVLCLPRTTKVAWTNL
ncbi:phosphonate C-P lyase system protein PhnH [Opitutales bacterium ASA1]|nr:phosphonate C-P lyase system protein PhnH [Opitutales bacterium ASA1]